PAIWSAIIDFHFFREITDADSRAAVRGVLVQRAVAWSLATLYFFGIAIWPEVAGRIGWGRDDQADCFSESDLIRGVGGGSRGRNCRRSSAYPCADRDWRLPGARGG